MADKKDMNLAIRITAAGSQAIRVIRSINSGIKTVTTSVARYGAVAAMAGKSAYGGFMMALKPAKLLAGAALGLGLVFGGLATKSLAASGDMESLRIRLEGVVATAEDAKRIFKETEDLSIKSPFEPQELIDARIALINVGVVGKAALEAVGDAASITQKPLGDLTSMIAAMETEPLRRIGISLKRESGSFEFTFRDKMQKVNTVVASGVDEARQALLRIFEVKYGGGMAKFANAWKGLVSTLSGNLAMAASRFGDGLMPAAKRFVTGLNDRLTELIESGKLQDWGSRVAETLVRAWDRAEAIFGFAQDVVARLKDSPAGMAEGLKIVMVGAGQILAITLTNYFSALGSVFVGLGKLLAGTFMEDILRLPGMGGARQSMMQAAGNADFGAFEKALAGMGLNKEDYIQGRMTKEQEVQLALGNRGNVFAGAIAEFTQKIPDLVKETAGAIAGVAGGMQNDLRGLAGPDIMTVDERQRRIDTERKQRDQAAAMTGISTVTMRRSRELGHGQVEHSDARYNVPSDKASALTPGQKTAYGTVVNIANFHGTFADWQQAQQDILAYAGMPVAVAGGL